MNELVKKIEELGFTTYESKVFLSLFKGFNMSAAEIAEDAKIPRTSAYDILKSFTKKGICNEISTPTKLRYQIINPKVVQDKFLKEVHTTYKTRLSGLKEAFQKLRPLYSSKRKTEDAVDIELLKGFNQHRDAKFYELLNSANKEVLLMNKLEGYMGEEVDREIKKFYKRGGVFKSIYEPGKNFRIKKDDKWVNVTPQDLIKVSNVFLKQGEKIKLMNKIPQFMVIFDRKVVFISILDATVPKHQNPRLSHSQTDLIIKNKIFATFLAELFNLYWEKGSTVKSFKHNLKT